MNTQYRRLSDSDIFWRKRCVRYIGMGIVAVVVLLPFSVILFFASRYPLEVAIGVVCVAAGIVAGRLTA